VVGLRDGRKIEFILKQRKIAKIYFRYLPLYISKDVNAVIGK
jgi:hypothetical protein